ncbi:hypothetical protein [Propionivibrio sp.]|uniref:hypothetical protein n=1 Tax=Propionivibrio sp. TaxID=2212460 RepID=UPI003BF231C5
MNDRAWLSAHFLGAKCNHWSCQGYSAADIKLEIGIPGNFTCRNGVDSTLHEEWRHGKAKVSIGVAAKSPEVSEPAETVLRLADVALYRAEDGGPNQFAIG